jgi:hypothetical protein
MTFAKTPAKLKLAMPEILENADVNLTPRMCNLVSLLWREWKDLRADRCDERGGRTDRLSQSSLSATQTDPGYWASGGPSQRKP